ncbi:MAG: rhomboid family intramembrane serine protease [Clostridiales bacterium]|nr:rhomboid family intramembrane serine protease [Clostridiales bacterium]
MAKINFDIRICLDDKSKKLTVLNRNYVFVVTVFIVLLNIIVYAVHGSDTGEFYTYPPQWHTFSVKNLFQALVNSYTHANWQHTLLNMLCFFIAGLYVERKKGSLPFLLFMVMMSLFTAFASTTNDISLWWHGFSGINFGMYGYIFVEYIFTLCQKEKRYLFNIVFGAIVVGLIYFAMCFCGGTERVAFKWYPYDLLNNLGHASGIVAGLILGLYEQLSSLILKYKKTSEEQKGHS